MEGNCRCTAQSIPQQLSMHQLLAGTKLNLGFFFIPCYLGTGSTYRKSQFHGLCLGARPRALPCSWVRPRAFTEGSIFQKRNPNCPKEHHHHFIAGPATAKDRWVHSLGLRGFPCQSWEWSLPSFQHARCHATVPPHPGEASSCIRHTGSILIPWPGTCCSHEGLKPHATHVPWALSELQCKMQMDNRD